MLHISSEAHRFFVFIITVSCVYLFWCTAHAADTGIDAGKTAPPAMAANAAQIPAASPPPPTIMMSTIIYEGNLSYPAPPWVATIKDLGNIKVFRDQTKNTFTLEQIPQDQEFATWTTLYGVYGWRLPDYDFQRFIAESLNALALGCKVQAKSRLVGADAGNVIMTYHCAELVEPLVQNGNDAESGFLYIGHVGSSYVKVYQAWRSADKDRDTPDWPVTEESAARAVERMRQIRFLPRKQ